MRAMKMFGLLSLVAFTAGCPVEPTDTDSATDTDTDTDTDTGTLPPLPKVLEGTITDAAGEPVAGANVFFCNYDICFQTGSDANGYYGFTNGDGSFALKIEATGYPVASTALESTTGGDVRVIDVTLPSFEYSINPSESAEHQIATDLYATFSMSGLDIPETTDGSVAGGAFVDSDIRLPDDAAVDQPVVGTWYLAPYDAKGKSGDIPFRHANAGSLGLADGDTVDVYVHSYKVFTGDSSGTEPQWQSAGTYTVTSGEISGTLPMFGTMLMYKSN